MKPISQRQEAIQFGETPDDHERRCLRTDPPGERIGWKIVMAGIAKYRRLPQVLETPQ